MFSLIDNPDNDIVIYGETYTVNDSFDNVMRMYEILDRNPNALGIELAIYTLIGSIPELDINSMTRLFKKLCQIYINDGEKPKVERDLLGNELPVQHKEWFSFKYDAWAIYSGFMQAYGMDLKAMRGKLRWCEFKALLNGLPSDTRFKEIVEIRQREYPEGKGTEKERQALRKAKEAVSYPGRDFT